MINTRSKIGIMEIETNPYHKSVSISIIPYHKMKY